MSNIQMEFNLKELIDKLDKSIDKLDHKIDKLDDKFDQKFDKLNEDVTNLKIGQEKIIGRIDTFDEKTTGIGDRIKSQEILNRTVVFGFILALLTGVAKMFGIIGNS